MDTGLLRGKRVLVTGANTGLGLASCLAMGRMGAQLILGCRDAQKGQAALEQVRASGAEAELLLMDLGRKASLREAAQRLSDHHPQLDVLMNNAGVFMAERTLGEDGIEATFSVNHLGPFLLTRLLMPLLRASPSARVVNLSSNAHSAGRLLLDDLGAERGYSAIGAYGDSKLANLLFNRSLARRLEGTKITSNAVHPGGVRTELGDTDSAWKRAVGSVIRWFLVSPEQGARTQVWVASAPELEGVSGRYYVKQREVQPSALAQDEQLAERLWTLSEELAGISGPL